MEDRDEMKPKALIKELLGEMPFTVEAYWLLRHHDKKIHSRFNLEALAARLPGMVAQVTPYAQSIPGGKKIFIFASMHSWINHITVTGLTLRGLGHDVTLGYLPFSDYSRPISRFDLRRHELYARHVLHGTSPLLKTIPFQDLEPAREIPDALSKAVEQVTIYDTQYTLQCEDVAGSEPVYLLRHQRNDDAARKAYAYFQKKTPDVVIVPNGMIQEYGAVYHAARALGITAITYEFGEMDQQIWIDRNRQVMFHFTDELWAKCRDRVLNDAQRTWLDSFLAGRQGLKTGTQFAHLWQKSSRQGGEKIRSALGLDSRPIVFLPTNVLGDSATLGRTIFSKSMAEWIERVVTFFANRAEVQLVIRIHPAETWTVGPSIAEIIRAALPEIPSHIHLIGSAENINTYDLMDLADLALVYTTTVGLEMAVRGIPVLVSGASQYRKKGFTLDADTWDEYFAVLNRALMDLFGYRLTLVQVERAWNYAYFYFKEYPRPFPWHLEKIWPSLEKRPLSYVLGPEGRARYDATFQLLAGEPTSWKD
jgi:hypothetical protein